MSWEPHVVLHVLIDILTDIRIDTAEKITATRLLLTGVFAFALKKKQHYLVISFVDQNGFTHNPVFEGIHMNAVYQAIYERLAAARAQAQPAVQEAQTAEVPTIDVTAQPPPSVYDELAKLAALRDQGIVTEQEFQEQKKKLLGTQTTNQSQQRFDPQTGRPL